MNPFVRKNLIVAKDENSRHDYKNMLWHWFAIMRCCSLFPEGNVARELAIYILLTVSVIYGVFNWYKEYKSKNESI